MSLHTSSIFFLLSSLVLSLFSPIFCSFEDVVDVDLVQFHLNLEFLEAEFYFYGTLGWGLDHADPKLAQGGPPPVGGQYAYLDPILRDIFSQFAFQQAGHLRYSLISLNTYYVCFNFLNNYYSTIRKKLLNKITSIRL